MNIDLHNHVVPPTIIDAIMRSPDRYGTKIEVWKARLELTGRIEKGNAGRQAWKRLKDDLMSRQKIRISGDYVWAVTS